VSERQEQTDETKPPSLLPSLPPSLPPARPPYLVSEGPVVPCFLGNHEAGQKDATPVAGVEGQVWREGGEGGEEGGREG